MRELVILGTSSQTPTRHRNHNGYLLRWDGAGLLFDPGEGTQRQLLLVGVAPSAITHICITHLHGDHCLGLPGVLQRLSLDGVEHPVHVYFPADGAEYVERLRHASIYDNRIDVVLHPVAAEGPLAEVAGATLSAHRLRHAVTTFGWRLVEPPGRRMLPERLAAAGVQGPDVGRLQRAGRLAVPDGRAVTLDEVSAPRDGQVFGFVMDTAECPGAEALADRADLLVTEATFAAADAPLAAAYRHLTAPQAGRLAARARARRLVLTHFSQRYPSTDALAEEARREAGAAIDVVAAEDLQRMAVPRRRDG